MALSFETFNNTTGDKTFEELREILNPKSLFVKKYDELGLFLIKYMKNKCNMKCSDTRLCRGLVLDTKTNHIFCAPPPKSVSLETCVPENTDCKDLVFEEFVDGTMINLFYCENDKYEGWLISTRSCIGANCRWYSDRNFSELFEETRNFNYDNLRRNYTYTFVLQHSENRIVEKINENRIVLVNVNEVYENNTIRCVDVEDVKLQLFHLGMHVDTPERFTFSSLQEAQEATKLMNYEKQGIVVKNGNLRSKIRNVKYNFVKELQGNTNDAFRNYLELRQNGYMNAYLEFFPEKTEQFQEFMTRIHNLTQDLFNSYQQCFVKKEVQHKDLLFVFKPLCYELHKHYLETNNIVTFNTVKNFINTMPVRRQMFLFRNLDKEIMEQEVED